MHDIRKLAAALATDHYVHIDYERARDVARVLCQGEPKLPRWDFPPYLQTQDPSEAVRFLLVLNTLNYCFTDIASGTRFAGYSPSPKEPGQAQTGTYYEGATLLAARIAEHWDDFRNPVFLMQVTEGDLLSKYLVGEEGPIPFAMLRSFHLNELGSFLPRLTGHYGSEAGLLLRSTNGLSVATSIAADLPAGFGADPFLKRAQLFAQMAAGRLQDERTFEHHWLATLTVPADYRVPQALRGLGVLHYAPELAGAVDQGHELPAGQAMELEVRAATILAVDFLAICAGFPWAPCHVDEKLWLLGRGKLDLAEGLDYQETPHHLTAGTHY